MTIKGIEKKEWRKYFNSFSKKFLKDMQPECTEIRVVADVLGMQPETEWMLLRGIRGITYDDKSDLLDIQLDKFNRLIHNPEEIYVDETDGGWLLSFEVVQHDGTKSIIEIR